MRARCLIRFRDLETGVLHEVGDVFEVTEERLEVMRASRYGVLAEKVETPKVAEKAPQEASQAPTGASPAPKRQNRRRVSKQE